MKMGDNAGSIAITCEDDNEDAVDIENADVLFKMRLISGGAVVQELAENLQVGDGTDGSLGMVEYAWNIVLPTEAGLWHAEFEVTYADGHIQTFPNTGFISVNVTEDL